MVTRRAGRVNVHADCERGTRVVVEEDSRSRSGTARMPPLLTQRVRAGSRVRLAVFHRDRPADGSGDPKALPLVP